MSLTLNILTSNKDDKNKNRGEKMVEFETLQSDEIKFGNNNFIEVARKKAISESGENVFISISRGFITPDGDKRYRKSFTVPLEKDVIDFVSEKIKEMGAEAAEATESKEEEEQEEEIKGEEKEEESEDETKKEEQE